MTAQPSREECRKKQLISATLRHIRDAEHLAEDTPNQSLDQAYHLAGYAPECMRKACLSSSIADLALAHDFGEPAEEVLIIAIALDTWAHRFHLRSWGSKFPEIGKWRPDCRYKATGWVQKNFDTKQLLNESRQAIDISFMDLFLPVLIHRKIPDEQRIIIVHSFAPLPEDSPAGKQERQEFRDRIYKLFENEVYQDKEDVPNKDDDPNIDDVPDEDDTSQDHFPYVLPHYDSLLNFKQMNEAVLPMIFQQPFSDLCDRIEEKCAPEEDLDTPEYASKEEHLEEGYES